MNFNLFELNSRLYPNPATDRFHISIPEKTGKCAVSISDINGQIVFKEQVISQNGVITVQLAKALKKGLYLVTVDGKDVQKLLID